MPAAGSETSSFFGGGGFLLLKKGGGRGRKWVQDRTVLVLHKLNGMGCGCPDSLDITLATISSCITNTKQSEMN
jgi:hypothetical protein